MKELGDVFQPEQYAQVDEDCILSDSVVALDFFHDFYEKEGRVLLGFFSLASLKDNFLPVWLYFLPKENKIVAAAPIFKVDNFDEVADNQITKTHIADSEMFFYWNTHLYASAYTSTGETIIRRIRCILSIRDMANIASLDAHINVNDVYPVKLYAEEDGRFLAVCWAIEANKNLYWYETVCADDDEIIDHIDANKTVSYPINIGETVILGDRFFKCAYMDSFGIYFDMTPVVATEKDRIKENIPLKRDNLERTKKKPLPRLSIVKNKPENHAICISLSQKK